MPRETIANAVRRMRRERGLSQARLSEMMREGRRHRVSAIERGEALPSMRELRQLARILGPELLVAAGIDDARITPLVQQHESPLNERKRTCATRIRTCLRCDQPFASRGPHNRMCPTCAQTAPRTCVEGWEYC